MISILRLLHVPCMRDTFPCVCKYVVLSNTDRNIIRSHSARIWPAGTGHSVLLLLSSPSELTQYASYCTAALKLTQWTTYMYDYEKSHWTCYFAKCHSDIHVYCV